jgi:hypothetical protein
VTRDPTVTKRKLQQVLNRVIVVGVVGCSVVDKGHGCDLGLGLGVAGLFVVVGLVLVVVVVAVFLAFRS